MAVVLERTGLPLVDRVLQGLVNAFNALERLVISRRNTVSDVALTTTDLAVPHGLRAPARGWLVVRKNANAVVYEGAAHENPGEFINLKASAAVTVTLVFF